LVIPAALLLQSLNLVNGGTFDTVNSLIGPDQSHVGQVIGCGMNLASDVDAQWAQNVLCFSPLNRGTPNGAYIVSAPVVKDTGSFTVAASWVGSSMQISVPNGTNYLFIYIPSWVSSHQFMMNSHPTELPYPATAVSYPFIMWDKLGKGQIVVNLGDPEVSKNYVGWVYNTLFLAMSKPVILEYTTNITEIPAFSIIALSFEIQLNNVYQENLVYVSTFQ